MSDLISRQAAIDAIDKTTWYHQNRNKDMVIGANSKEHQAWYKAEDVYKALESVPDALPERKKGKWRRRLVDCGFNADWHCSECDWKTSLEEHGYNFCPNCGADMRGEQDG